MKLTKGPLFVRRLEPLLGRFAAYCRRPDRAGCLDEAEQAAHDLLTNYPHVHDGLERVAMVYAARGDRVRAAEYYRKAADFVHAHAEQYGPNMEIYLRRRVTELESASG